MRVYIENIYLYIYASRRIFSIPKLTRIYIRVCVYIYTCIYMYISVYIYIYTRLSRSINYVYVLQSIVVTIIIVVIFVLLILLLLLFINWFFLNIYIYI